MSRNVEQNNGCATKVSITQHPRRVLVISVHFLLTLVGLDEDGLHAPWLSGLQIQLNLVPSQSGVWNVPAFPRRIIRRRHACQTQRKEREKEGGREREDTF